jgi:hypothetical protein
MMKIALTLAMLAGVSAECPNACSGHGSCGAYDQCSCYPNWQAADCSEMTCAFGLAHVDTPKGDLDMSASALSSPTTTVLKGSTVYPYGTTEQYPQMTDSSGKGLKNTAHYYMECSNKGICDRKSGECECFDGYEGSFCQRAACPNACSGHGTCETIAELAEDEFDNIYALWDKDMTMGCSCDPGYGGADCSSRMCKYGIDPLYIDDESTARVASSTYIVRPGFDGLDGTYAIKFFDVFGDDFITEPIKASSTTTCLEVVSALEALPNTVIPSGSVFCSDYIGQYDEMLGSYAYEATVEGGFHMYSLTFTGNPGYLKPIEIDSTLDGVRPTTNTSTAVWSDGMSGEFTDYFATQCEHVYVTITPMDQKGGNAVGSPDLTTTFTAANVLAGDPTMFDTLNVYGYIDSLTATESKLLKKCLGDSDGDSTNNVEVYDWDYGAIKYWSELSDTYLMSGTPHAIKLVKKSPADDYDGGKFALVWYNPKDDMFYIATKASDVASEYAVFTTDGVAERVYTDSNSDSAYNATETAAVAWFKQFETTLYMSMDTSCESGGSSVEPCLQKGDLIFIADANWGKADLKANADVQGGGLVEFFGGGSVQAYSAGFADTADLYTITKIWKAEETVKTDYTPQIAAMEDKFRITVDKSINWDGSIYADPDGDGTSNTGYVQIIKFTPATTGTFTYVSQCSNRGLCNGDDALCECFKGYTNDNCDTQSSLAV